MWNHAKNSMKQLKRPTSLISYWLPVKIVQNGPKLCKRKRVASRCVFLRGIQICYMKADVQAIPKMWWFFILQFFKPKLLLPKVGSNLKIFFCKIVVSQKKTRLHFLVSRLHMNRTCVSHGTFEVLFITEPKTQNCSRVIFPNGFLFLLTLLKFQIPLTLSSHS